VDPTEDEMVAGDDAFDVVADADVDKEDVEDEDVEAGVAGTADAVPLEEPEPAAPAMTAVTVAAAKASAAVSRRTSRRPLSRSRARLSMDGIVDPFGGSGCGELCRGGPAACVVDSAVEVDEARC
jgi:hypothetical protein